MSPSEGPLINLAERRPKHLAEIILRQDRQRLAEQRTPCKQDAAAKEYVRARTFLQLFRLSLIMFLTSLACAILQAVLPYMAKGTMAWFELAALGENSTVGVIVMVVAFRRKRQAERLVEQANRAAEARKLAVLLRA